MATQFDPIAKDESLNTTESPSRNVADVLAQGLDAIEQAIAGGSGSGGHVIVDADGTDMAQRAKMQFVDAEVTDDAVNDVTKISTTPASYPSANVTYGSGSVEDALDEINADRDGIKIKSIDGTIQNSAIRQTIATISDATTIYGIVATVEVSVGNVSVPVGVTDGNIEVDVIGNDISIDLKSGGVSTFGNRPIHVVAFYK